MAQQNDKGVGLSFLMLAGTALIIIAVLKGVSALLHGINQPDMSAEAVTARIQPVGKVNTGAPIVAQAPAAAPKASSAARTGEQVYSSTCQACHATGAAGAPKLGDAAAWAPRIKQGMDTLVKNAVNGIRGMPPRGTCGNCSDTELRSAVEYMVSKSR